MHDKSRKASVGMDSGCDYPYKSSFVIESVDSISRDGPDMPY